MIDLAEISAANNSKEAAASYSLSSTEDSIVATQSTEIQFPREYLEDNFVVIRQSDLKKARMALESVVETKKSFPFAELFLAVATTLLGAFLTALLSEVQLNSTPGIFSYCICPPLIVASFATFLWFRKSEPKSVETAAERALEHLTNPQSFESSQNR